MGGRGVHTRNRCSERWMAAADLPGLRSEGGHQTTEPLFLRQLLTGQIDAADVVNRTVVDLAALDLQVEVVASQPNPQAAQGGTPERPAALIGSGAEMRQQLGESRGDALGLFQCVVVTESQLGGEHVEGEVGIEAIRIERACHEPSLALNLLSSPAHGYGSAF